MNRARPGAEIDAERSEVGRRLPASTGIKEREQYKQAEAADDRSGPGSEFDKVTAERDALIDRLARAQADFENARKRMEREQQESRSFAVGDALKSLLPIMDSMELALRSPDPEEFRRGVDLIRQQMENALQNLGVRRIPVKGEPFDPYLHEAIEVVDTTAAGDGEVLEEVRPGYRLGERLLRPAMVLVACNRAA